MVISEVVSLIEGEWSCYRGSHFNGGRMVMLRRWSVYWKENGHVTEVASFNGRRMVMLQRWSLMEGEWSCYRSGHQWRENGHVTEVESLMEGEWFCYRGGRFNGGGFVMLERWLV